MNSLLESSENHLEYLEKNSDWNFDPFENDFILEEVEFITQSTPMFGWNFRLYFSKTVDVPSNWVVEYMNGRLSGIYRKYR